MNCHQIAHTRQLWSGLLVGSFVLGATLLSTPASAQETAAAPEAELSVRRTPTAPTVAWSEDNALIFSLRSTTYETPDASFDAVGDTKGYLAAQLEVGYDLGAVLLPGLRGYAIYSGGGYPDRTRFGGELDLSWERHLLMVAADYGPELWGIFRPSVRLGAGYALQVLDTEVNGITRSGYAHGIAGFGSISLELFTPKGFLGRAQVGVIVEAGGVLQSAASFDEMEELDGPDGDWTHEQASMGGLSASGRFVTAGAELRINF